ETRAVAVLGSGNESPSAEDLDGCNRSPFQIRRGYPYARYIRRFLESNEHSGQILGDGCARFPPYWLVRRPYARDHFQFREYAKAVALGTRQTLAEAAHWPLGPRRAK